MKKQNRVQKKGSPTAPTSQPKTAQSRAAHRPDDPVTCMFYDPDGREWARVPEHLKPKPQFKPLLEIEREICQRFSSVRRGSEFSQAEIALKLGLSRNQIANIEACRVPLKFWIGNRFCEYVNISQLWLATGRLPKAPYSVLNESFYSPKPDSNALFSLVCLGQLREVLEMRRRYSAAVKDRELAPDFLADSYQLLFKELLPILVFEIPEAARLDFVDFLISGTKRFIAERSVRANVENKVLWVFRSPTSHSGCPAKESRAAKPRSGCSDGSSGRKRIKPKTLAARQRGQGKRPSLVIQENMKKQNRVQKKGSPTAPTSQPKTAQSRAAHRPDDPVTCMFYDPDGREWARVDFPRDIFARIKHCASSMGIPLSRFFYLAIRNHIRSQQNRRAA